MTRRYLRFLKILAGPRYKYLLIVLITLAVE